MFNLCANMEWAHLPIAGGIYDQDPELFEYWEIIWGYQAEKAKADKAKADAETRRRKNK